MDNRYDDYLSDELKIDRIIELHDMETRSEPICLRNGYCIECSVPELDLWILYPCDTIKIAKGLV